MTTHAMHYKPVKLPASISKHTSDRIGAFNPSGRLVMTVENRLTDLMAQHPTFNSMINGACAIFKSTNKQVTVWEDLNLPEAKMMPFDEPFIDIWRQRDGDIDHVTGIVTNFSPMLVQPLSVYQWPDEETGEMSYRIWDGQHTALALYIIATRILGITDLSKILVPVSLSRPKSLDEVRRTFVTYSTTARKPFTVADVHRQHVLGYRMDGCRSDINKMAHMKQQALETVGMYPTHTRNKDTKKPGAFSNLSQFMDDKYSISVHRGFAHWVKATCGNTDTVTRFSNGAESYQVYEFLHLCEKCKINFTNDNFQYVYDAVNALQVAYKGNFTAETLHYKAKASHDAFWTKIQGKLHGVDYQSHVGDVHFMIAQLEKYMPGVPLPKFADGVSGRWEIPASHI